MTTSHDLSHRHTTITLIIGNIYRLQALSDTQARKRKLLTSANNQLTIHLIALQRNLLMEHFLTKIPLIAFDSVGNHKSHLNASPDYKIFSLAKPN